MIEFDISVSLQPYKDKETINWAWLKYQQHALNVEKFAELIKQGYCFCQCFRTEQQQFGIKEKTDKNFKEAHMLFIDIDDSNIEMNMFVRNLSKKPSLYYTTPSNHTKKSDYRYRFRLCYLFSEAITSVSQYQSLYDAVMQSVNRDMGGFLNKDNCGRSPSQQFGGNGNGNCELHNTDIVYSLSDFPIQNNNVLSSFLLISNGKSDSSKPLIKDVEIIDNEFIMDVNRLKPTELIDKYKGRYDYFTHTELDFQDGFALIPKDYIEIYRSWYIDIITKENGDTCQTSIVKKLRDNNGRRKKLFIAGLIMKKILPSITFEHLLYNLICERFYYYDNSDRVLSNKELIRISKEVINTPIEKINLNCREKRKFIVDKAYCAEHNIPPNEMKNRVRKKLKDEEIGNVYDCSLSLKENLVNLKAMGIKVGKSKLYQWCKENGISTKEERGYHNPYQKIRELQYDYYPISVTDKQFYRNHIKELRIQPNSVLLSSIPTL